MRNRVKATSKFIINEEKKIVVCVLNCDMQLFKGEESYLYSNKVVGNDYVRFGEFSVTGISRCNDSDTFDINIGKKIAESRAKVKMFNRASKIYTILEADILNRVNKINELQEACDKASEIEASHLEALL